MPNVPSPFPGTNTSPGWHDAVGKNEIELSVGVEIAGYPRSRVFDSQGKGRSGGLKSTVATSQVREQLGIRLDPRRAPDPCRQVESRACRSFRLR